MPVLKKPTKKSARRAAKAKFDPQPEQDVLYKGNVARILWEVGKIKGRRAFKIRTSTMTGTASITELSEYKPHLNLGPLGKVGIAIAPRELCSTFDPE